MKTYVAISLFTVLCSSIHVAQLHAQNAVFTVRNGANTAYCGPVGGPVVLHRFSLPEPTHDIASVSEPGTTDWSRSSAVSQLDVTTSDAGITISAVGSAERGPLLTHGVYAVADARDDWEFSLAAPARFTFTATLSTSSTETSGVNGGFSFGGAGTIPDPGTSPDAFGGGLPASGSIVRQAKGRLLPGRYSISLNCRADGTTYPYSGSFNCALALELGPDLPAIVMTRILPQGLEIEWTDPGPKQYTVETTSSLSGESWAPVNGVAWPISAHTILLPPPAAFPTFYRVKME